MRYDDRADRDRSALYDGSGDTRSRLVKQLPARPRLESRLDGALTHRLTVLVADAGFGKTTLLGSWSAGIRAVVYPVATGDRDLTRLWQHLVGALQRRLPEVTEGMWAGEVRGPVSARSESVRPQAMAELLGQALAQRLTEDLVLVLDDAHLVADGPAASFVAGLVRHAPPLLHVVLASRGPLPVSAARLRTQGQVLELTGADLAFTTGEVATLLAEVVGADARGLAERLRAGTGGWPIAVRLAVEAVRDLPPGQRSGRLARLATPDGQLADLIGAIYAQEAAPVRRLLVTGALFGRFPVGLCEALGVPDAAAMIAGLTRRGLFLEPAPESRPEPYPGSRPEPYPGSRPEPPPSLPGTSTRARTAHPALQWYRLHPLARRFLTEQQPLPASEVAKLRETAVHWLVDHGLAHTALRWLVPGHPDGLTDGDADDGQRRHRAVAELLADAGERLAAIGHAAVVVDAVETLPPEFRDPRIEQLAGHAYLVRGDWDEALACYARAAGDRDRLPAGLAWRIGMVHYLRGEHDQALAVYERAEVASESTRDTGLLLAWAASAHWIRGDAKACGELATRALEIATEVGDAAALAAAHTVLSMLAALKGDRRANAARYRRALEYAWEAGDVLQLIRIHSNRASHSLEEGDYGPAMAELEVAIGLADVYGYGAYGGLALTNRAEIRLRLGQLEEAHHDIETALAIFEDLSSRTAAYPLSLLGRLHQLRGDDAAAVRAYERALAHVAASGDRQAQVAVLAGLARVLADTDPDRAAGLAEQALAAGDGMGYVDALVASARVAAATALDPAVVKQRAQAAREVAQARRDRPGIAEAYEIEAAVADTEPRARELAGRAVALWAEIGDRAGQARAELALAEHLDPAAARATAEAVRERMGTIGCRSLTARAETMLARADTMLARAETMLPRAETMLPRPGEAVPAAAARPVRVETLGGFRVVRDGTVLTGPAWSSRKARDVLKIMVARRGRPVTREFLMEALWPGQPPAALANRLHVAISALRTTLDPERHYPGDTFVATDDATIRLRLEHVQVDVEEFLEDATAGLALLRPGRVAEALPRLTRADSRYAGDFLEEDLYEDWAVPVREQARTTYLSVAGRLAQQAEAAGDVDAAARYLLRMLEHDPYDERAHLRLVSTLAAAGRHGDARRHYRHYCARMDELEVEAAPFPTSDLSGG